EERLRIAENMLYERLSPSDRALQHVRNAMADAAATQQDLRLRVEEATASAVKAKEAEFQAKLEAAMAAAEAQRKSAVATFLEETEAANREFKRLRSEAVAKAIADTESQEHDAKQAALAAQEETLRKEFAETLQQREAAWNEAKEEALAA
ncbi:unnamed protein product, partial [Symbiodinium sp. KB8]